MRKRSLQKRALKVRIPWLQEASGNIQAVTVLVWRLKSLVLGAAELGSLLYLLYRLSFRH